MIELKEEIAELNAARRRDGRGRRHDRSTIAELNAPCSTSWRTSSRRRHHLQDTQHAMLNILEDLDLEKAKLEEANAELRARGGRAQAHRT